MAEPGGERGGNEDNARQKRIKKQEEPRKKPDEGKLEETGK